MTCPTDNVLAELVDGTLDDSARGGVERHLDHCATCTELVSELASVIAPPPAAPPRYRLLRELAADVWEAEGTPRVAISFGVPCAAALAAVRDPHVVRVDEVGRLGGRDYVVHELAGKTERQWRRRARTTEEVVAVWQHALAGLNALHRANVCFALSPDHVFIADDGRVRIGGFAKPVGKTSGYLAPECLRGAAATARSDQFSACVAIWEALTGERPFSGATAGALAVRTTAAPVATDARLRVLARGLAYDPAHRWPDVPTLAAAFANPPSSRAALVAIVLIAAAIVVWYLAISG